MGWVCQVFQRDAAKSAGLAVVFSESSPSATSLASAASSGDLTIEVNSESDYSYGDWIRLGSEFAQVKELDGGSGPTYTWILVNALLESHAANTSVLRVPDVRHFRQAGERIQDIALLDQEQSAIESDIQGIIDSTRTILGI